MPLPPQGISFSNNQITAISDFPVPSTDEKVRQFFGLALYYCRFIHLWFVKVAQPLHCLTQKGATFQWSSECKQAFQQLKHFKQAIQQLLAYPISLKLSF